MLDINLFRNEQAREKIKVSEKKRFREKNVEIVDTIHKLDEERIRVNFRLDNKNRELNTIQNKLTQAFKQNNKENSEESLETIKNQRQTVKKEAEELKTRAQSIKSEIDKLLFGIGNILDDSVPVHRTDDGNVVVSTHRGFRDCSSSPKGYAELMKDFTNAEAGAAVVGHRGFYLQGKMALLSRALKNYAIDFVTEKGFEYVQTPVMMRMDVMGKTSQLSDFHEQLYKVEDDLYLIATSEQPLTALFMNKKLTDVELPKLLAGDSLCFRKEAGAYGKDNAGIFRVHQFDKVEQFVICKPEESAEMHEKMLKISEEFYQSLGLTYQVVLISSGEMNDAASKKYDLEAWFPNAKKYRELVSASNCTDYQSRNLNVGHGFPKENERQSYVHMLNATLCAVQRSLCCIVENYQDGNKIIVPDVLKPYTKFDSIDL